MKYGSCWLLLNGRIYVVFFVSKSLYLSNLKKQTYHIISAATSPLCTSISMRRLHEIVCVQIRIIKVLDKSNIWIMEVPLYPMFSGGITQYCWCSGTWFLCLLLVHSAKWSVNCHLHLKKSYIKWNIDGMQYYWHGFPITLYIEWCMSLFNHRIIHRCLELRVCLVSVES